MRPSWVRTVEKGSGDVGMNARKATKEMVAMTAAKNGFLMWRLLRQRVNLKSIDFGRERVGLTEVFRVCRSYAGCLPVRYFPEVAGAIDLP